MGIIVSRPLLCILTLSSALACADLEESSDLDVAVHTQSLAGPPDGQSQGKWTLADDTQVGSRTASISMTGAFLTARTTIQTSCGSPWQQPVAMGSSVTGTTASETYDTVRYYAHNKTVSRTVPGSCWAVGEDGRFHAVLHQVSSTGRAVSWTAAEASAAKAYINAASGAAKGARANEVQNDPQGKWGTEAGLDVHAPISASGFALPDATGTSVNPALFETAYRAALAAWAVYYDYGSVPQGTEAAARAKRAEYLSLANLTEIAYKNESRGIPPFARLESAEALAATSGDLIVLAFAGTDPAIDPQDVYHDARTTLTNIKDVPGWEPNRVANVCSAASKTCKIHYGFGQYANYYWEARGTGSVYAAVAAKYNEIKAQGRTPQLWITGHSLGGSMSQIVASYYAVEHYYDKTKPAVTKVITFGSPMVGDASFASVYETQLNLNAVTQRWAHKDDPGPQFPALSMGAYKHAGRQHSFDAPTSSSTALRKLNTLYAPGPTQKEGSWDFVYAFFSGEGNAHAGEGVYIASVAAFLDCESPYLPGGSACMNW